MGSFSFFNGNRDELDEIRYSSISHEAPTFSEEKMTIEPTINGNILVFWTTLQTKFMYGDFVSLAETEGWLAYHPSDDNLSHKLTTLS